VSSPQAQGCDQRISEAGDRCEYDYLACSVDRTSALFCNPEGIAQWRMTCTDCSIGSGTDFMMCAAGSAHAGAD